jgi:hypothetical protein
MKYLRAGCPILLCWVLVEVALTLREFRTLPIRTERQLAETRAEALAAVEQAATRAEKQIAALRSDLRAEIGITRVGLLARVDTAGARIDARTAEIQQQVVESMSRVTNTASSATLLLEDARRGVEVWTKLSPSLGANTLGLIAAAKVTAGETAETMREIREATPDLLQSVRVSALASQQAAQSAAETSQHLAEITKPGPRWLRYVGVGATVALPASQIALPFTVLSK